MNRWQTWTGVLVLAAGCGVETAEGQGTDTSTDWMAACDTDGECSSEAHCGCGVCTRECAGDEDCSALGQGTVCVRTPTACATDEAVCVPSDFSWDLLDASAEMSEPMSTLDVETTDGSAPEILAPSALLLTDEHNYEATSTTTRRRAHIRLLPGIGALSMVFVRPTSSSTNAVVNVPTACSADETARALEVHAQFSDTTLGISPDDGLVIDWSGVTKDSGVDGFTTTANLAGAANRAEGAPFPGFTRTHGVWVLGLNCPGCQNGIPTVLTVVEPL
jgi:hypothetical protein